MIAHAKVIPDERRSLDEDARERARTCFDRPLVLQAGAGTGKTATLIARLVTWALRDGWRRSAIEAVLEPGTPEAIQKRASVEGIARRVLERIVSITFTEKAAAEMAERFDAALQKVAAGKDVVGLSLSSLRLDLETLAERASALAGVSDRLQVSTIHAYCRRLLAEHALAAGLHPRFEVDADLSRMRRLADEVFFETLERELSREAEEDADLERLLALGEDPSALAETLRSLVDEGIPAEWLAEAPDSVERVRAAVLELRQAIDPLLAAAGPSLDGVARAKSGARAIDTLRDLRTSLEGIESVESLVELARRDSVAAALPKIKEWRRGKFTKTESEQFADAARAIEESAGTVARKLSHFARLRPDRLPALTRVFSSMLSEVQRRARRRGIESFALLLRDARDLLRDHPDIRAEVRGKLDQLLVDEFQDTDPVQCELVEMLALAEDSSPGPQLFLVGDPKQSIYGWRDADLAAYERFVNRVLENGGEKHVLSVNYRSVPAILDEVERVVEPIMREDAGLQPPFEGLLPSEANENAAGVCGGSRRPVEHWISWRREGQEDGNALGNPETSAEDAREIEARALARDVLDQVRRHDRRFRDFAILLRSTTSQETYARALREAGVPYVVEKDRSWYQRREVLDTTALLRTILDPSDRLAQLAWLRSPTVGVPDGALPSLWESGAPDLMAELQSCDRGLLRDLDEAIETAADKVLEVPGVRQLPRWPLLLKQACRTLGALRESFRIDPSDVFVDRVRSLSLAAETEAARFLGEHRVANLEVLWRDLQAWLEDDELCTAAIVRELRRATEAERNEDEDTPGDDSLDAVRVMTIHKAKGLTFRQVYFVNLHAKSGQRVGAVEDCVEWTEGRAEYCLLGAPSLGFDKVAERKTRVEAAEAVRLTYVALTRASERMVLAGAWSRRPGRPERAERLLDLIQQRRGVDPTLLAAGLRGSREQEAEWLDDERVRWRLPDASIEVIASIVEARPSMDSSILEVEQRQLQRWRQQARQHQERPRVISASKAAREELAEAAPPERQGMLFESSNVAPEERRDIAIAVGSAVHAFLEQLDLDRELSEQVVPTEEWRARLASELEPAQLEPAWTRFERELRHLRQTSLLKRLETLREHVLGREVAMLLQPRESEAAVDAMTGTLDLLYIDPSDESWVVADYKTDAITRANELGRRAASYAAQGEIYVRAVRTAFPKAPQVRFELWFLTADRVVVPALEGDDETENLP